MAQDMDKWQTLGKKPVIALPARKYRETLDRRIIMTC
jgi:hypothetical protein